MKIMNIMKNQAFSKIWIMVILVAIIGGGSLIWNYSGIQNNDNEINEEISEDETADWETYRNEEYEFEIKYPASWTFQEHITIYLSKKFSGEEANIDIEMIKENDNRYITPLEQMVDNEALEMKNVIQPKNKIYIGEKEGYEIIGTTCTRICTGGQEDIFTPFAIVYLSHNNKIYKISYAEGITKVGWKDDIKDWKYYDEFKKILSTFKFLE